MFHRKLYTNSDWTPDKLDRKIINLVDDVLLDFDKHEHEMNEYCNRYRQDNLNTVEREFLTNIRKNKLFKKIYITPADKNLGCTVMHVLEYLIWLADYFTKNKHAYQMIDFTTEIEFNSIKDIKSGLYDKVLSWHKTFSFDIIYNNKEHEKTFKVLNKIKNQAFTGTINRFYAMPKLHKKHTYLTWGVRPICSYSGSQLELLSVWLDLQLRDLLNTEPIILHSSDQLLEVLDTFILKNGDILVTADVTALYTNINNTKALRVFDALLTKHKHILKDSILKGLEIIMENNYFSIGNTIFKQTGGTAMGTPVAVAYANLFLAHYENLLLPFYPEFILYYRYIDDVFAVFRPKIEHLHLGKDNPRLHEFFNKIQRMSSLEFEVNTSMTDVIILDLSVFRVPNSNKLHTKTYQKDLNLYQYLLNTSAHPKACLNGLIVGLIQSYYKQNSFEKDFIYIVGLLKDRLVKRGYSYSTIHNLIRKAVTDTLNKPPLPYSIRKQIKITNSTNNFNNSKLFYPLRYDPSFTSNNTLRHTLRINYLEHQMKTNTTSLTQSKIITSFYNPPNLRKILIRSQPNTTYGNKFHDIYKQRIINQHMDIKQFLIEMKKNIT